MLQSLFSGRRTDRMTPSAAVGLLRTAVAAGPTDSRAKEDITRAVSALKAMLFDASQNTSDHASRPTEEDALVLTRLACATDLLEILARNLSLMEFETRKDAVQVFNHLLRRGADGVEKSGRVREAGAKSAPDVPAGGGTDVDAAVDGHAISGGRGEGRGDPRQDSEGAKDDFDTTVIQVAKNDGMLLTYLVDCYDDTEIALNCGAMLRECLRDELLGRLVLESKCFWRFFELVEKNDFDIASDAFSSFKDLLTRHQAVAASFIVANLDRFVQEYNRLLRSNNYYTRRQSLKLLGEMLIERANFRIMTQYISSAENLKLVMNLLLDNRKNIQFEAFHVFKVFVANPNKPTEIRQILCRNKERMYDYLNDFLIDRDDEQFHVDRKRIIDEISALS